MKFSSVLFLVFFCTQIHAVDLFDGGKLKDISKGDLVTAGDTVGGYPIYSGDGTWQFDGGKTDMSVGSTATPMGSVSLAQREGNSFLAGLNITANLRRNSITGGRWNFQPCVGDFIYFREKGSGNNLNCLTIKANEFMMGDRPTTFLTIKIVNAGDSGRFYLMDLGLSLNFLGFRNSAVNDWQNFSSVKDGQKKAFLEKVIPWANALQDAAEQAFNYDKPANAFSKIPSWRFLLPVPEDLAGQQVTSSFLSAIEDLKYRPNESAIAYSSYGPLKTRWANSFGRETKEEAQRRALMECEKDRPDTAPPCKIYEIRQSTALQPQIKQMQELQKINQVSDIESKLTKLKYLREKDLITRDQYDQEVREILKKAQ